MHLHMLHLCLSLRLFFLPLLPFYPIFYYSNYCFKTKQILREEEFAPVKNANGASYDTPDTARLMLLRLHSRWVVAAGGFLTHSVPLYLTGIYPTHLVPIEILPIFLYVALYSVTRPERPQCSVN